MALSGHRRRLADWEHHLEQMMATASPPVPGIDVYTNDPVGLLRNGAWTSAELEVLQDTVTPDELEAIVGLNATSDTESVLAALEAPAVPVNANRRITVTGRLRGAVDLTVPTLPSRREEQDWPLTFGCREVRLVVGPTWFVAVWRPIEGPWDPTSVRWPHFGVPSRTASWRAGRFGGHLTPTKRRVGFLTDLCEHVEYQLGSWSVEQEMWEQGLFTSLASGATTFDGLDLAPSRRELGQLAEFLNQVRRAQRGLIRRAEVDPVLSTSSVQSICHKTAQRLDAGLDTRRNRVREAFALLADIATGIQAHQAERQRAATERVQDIITFVATVLLVPALVVSVYGANLRELSADAYGDLASLAVVMVASSVAATVAFQAVRSRSHARRPIVGMVWVAVASAAVGLTVAIGLIRGWWQGLALASVLLGALVIAVSAIAGTVITYRRMNDRGSA